MLIGILRVGVIDPDSSFFLLTRFLPAFSRTLVGKYPLPRILEIASAESVASTSSLTSCPEEFIASNANVGMWLSAVRFYRVGLCAVSSGLLWVVGCRLWVG